MQEVTDVNISAGKNTFPVSEMEAVGRCSLMKSKTLLI